MISFTLHDLESMNIPNEKLPEDSVKRKVERLLGGGSIEACSDFNDKVISGNFSTEILANSLAEASFSAYYDHRTLILSPDHIWITLTQGLANHVNQDAENLRHHFVDHEGKLKLVVKRDDFIKMGDNNWPSVFSEFSEKIALHIGRKNHAHFIADFSTTGVIEKSVSELVLLNAMNNYFEFVLSTFCGIPKFILEGEVNDWISIRNRVSGWGMYGLDWWVDQLLPCLDQFILAAKGDVDKNWWRSWFKEKSEGSGDIYLSGHITKFFPYIFKSNSLDKDTKLVRTKFDKMTTDQFPGGLSSTPFIWIYGVQDFQMEFIGGFVGTSQLLDSDTQFALRPKIGWAVRDVSKTE